MDWGLLLAVLVIVALLVVSGRFRRPAPPSGYRHPRGLWLVGLVVAIVSLGAAGAFEDLVASSGNPVVWGGLAGLAVSGLVFAGIALMMATTGKAAVPPAWPAWPAWWFWCGAGTVLMAVSLVSQVRPEFNLWRLLALLLLGVGALEAASRWQGRRTTT